MTDAGLKSGLSVEILDWLRAVSDRFCRARAWMDDAIFRRLWSELDDLPLVFTLDVLDWGRLPAVRIRATLSMMAGRFSGYRSSSGFPTCDTGRLPILDGITFLRL